MLNRALQVNWVKPQKQDAVKADKPDDATEEKTTIVAYTADRVVKKVALATLAYVALDTVRQVMVAKANK